MAIFPINIKTQSVVVEAKGTTERRAGIEASMGVQAGSSLWVQCRQTLSHSGSSPLGQLTSLFPLHKEVGDGCLLLTTEAF